ncbi:uncharacterized protein KGF55_000785 [Candida pseudojiufengensis]|uniref:uncharacterized protein n=1 Tax=Candida pseudojiufengensis TaxID=497109 RepID=UPI002225AE2C|nr:uncharacterized protein KGF55_000785 [Candida pseudojiufengensis]KAI5966476.1 hypothetical protein KGF55_000785 [Candida pseudojiufengensis]
MKSKKSFQVIPIDRNLPHKKSHDTINKKNNNNNNTIPTLKVVLLGDSGVGKTCLRSQFIHHVFTNAYKATIGGDYLTTTIELQQPQGKLKSKSSKNSDFSEEDSETLSDLEPEHNETINTSSSITQKPSSNSISIQQPPPPQKPQKLNLQVWDTAGQERFNSISKAFYRGTDICILCYDITNYESLLSLKNWFLKFIENCHVLKPGFIIVGNKLDKSNNRVIDKEEVRDILTNDITSKSQFRLSDYINDWDLDVIEISAKNHNLVNDLFQRVGELGMILNSENNEEELNTHTNLQNFDKIDLLDSNKKSKASSCAC